MLHSVLEVDASSEGQISLNVCSWRYSGWMMQNREIVIGATSMKRHKRIYSFLPDRSTSLISLLPVYVDLAMAS